ncbi:hypothetical protein HF325_000355 [Metschnikowia pulcherrima]|uniref:U1 small nuclear ribonucleoprotein component SNU71 n=1 Tax=Metschnikowia pulcherrima TaxID=27326 RepID=A0A8H7H029_9ASCO|nr:hypothetical protein HF325_000355 [Metschnikowia pulcherrima]
MSEIKLVAPFTASNGHHKLILDLIKHTPAPISGPVPVFQIPVRLDVDVTAIIGRNGRKMPENGNENILRGSGSMHTESDSLEDSAEDAEADETPPSYMELSAFQPRNRLEQVTTIFLQDFPALRPKQVDRVFSKVASACPLDHGKEYRFSLITESINDTRGVFLRFSTVKVTQWARQTFPTLFPNITTIFDESLVDLAEENDTKTPDLLSLGSLAAEIAAIFANKKLYSRRSGRSGTEDLDEVMQYYRTYKVENSELVEVPKELKEVIVRDIIKFRAKVLTIEREARKKEIEKERRKAKLRLTLIFEDHLSDEEYEKHLAAEAKAQLEAQFAAQHKEMRKLEQNEKAALLEKLHTARGYEQALVENKLALMDEYKAVQDHGVQEPVIMHDSGFTSVGAKMKLYYNNHGEYIRIRSHERSKEEALDDADRTEEFKSLDQPKDAPIFAATISNTKQASKILKQEQSNPSSIVNVVVSTFSEGELAAVKEKIGSLIEEFLGIREDVLIEFIYDFVLENNLSSREDLIAELQETLDEDSTTVAEQLHEYIASVAEHKGP